MDNPIVNRSCPRVCLRDGRMFIISRAQEKAIDFLFEEIVKADRFGLGAAHNYEYKEFSFFIDDTGGDVPRLSLLSEVGQKDDEGTLAATPCRTQRLIRIGRRGGLELANAKYKKYSRGKYAAFALTVNV